MMYRLLPQLFLQLDRESPGFIRLICPGFKGDLMGLSHKMDLAFDDMYDRLK